MLEGCKKLRFDREYRFFKRLKVIQALTIAIICDYLFLFVVKLTSKGSLGVNLNLNDG